MPLEIQIGDRIAKVELIESEENIAKICIDDKEYEVDILKVRKGSYSILLDGNSYNVNLAKQGSSKKYNANIFYDDYDLEIIDAETKYKRSRKSGDTDDESFISSPMPGKIVKILVKKGDRVKANETVIIISAMKMESEYKVKQDRLIKEVKVKEGDTIDGNQPLIIIE